MRGRPWTWIPTHSNCYEPGRMGDMIWPTVLTSGGGSRLMDILDSGVLARHSVPSLDSRRTETRRERIDKKTGILGRHIYCSTTPRRRCSTSID